VFVLTNSYYCSSF